MTNSKVHLIVRIASFVLLVPVTLSYFFGMCFALLSGFFSLFFKLVNASASAEYFVIAGVLIVPGYGLVSLWWLVLTFDTITFSDIPFFIYGGLIAGAIASILFLSPWGLGSDSYFYPLIGGVPLIVLFTLVLLIWMRSLKMKEAL